MLHIMPLRIEDWLEEIGLPQYAAVLAENDVDADVLFDLSDSDLRELGLSLGHRKRLLKEIDRLKRDEADRREGDCLPSGLHQGTTPRAGKSAQAPSDSENERRQLTVLFCDLVGSATFSEALDPEDLRELLSAYYRCSSKPVERFGGKIDKFVGDGITAFFGYPVALEDAAVRAVLAGLQIVQDIEDFNESLHLPKVKIKVRIGISSGIVVTGSIGEGTQHEEFGIVGDVPVIASRLQTLAEPGEVLIGEATKRLVDRRLELRFLGTKKLKGVLEPVRVYAALKQNLKNLSREGATGGGESTSNGQANRFVGREAEIAILLDTWQRSSAGEGQAVLVSGEPGIGKSRMIQAMIERIEGEAPPVLHYNCSPYLTNSAFHPLIEQLRDAAGFEEDDDSDVKLDKLEIFLERSGCNPRDMAPFLAGLLNLPTEQRYGESRMTPAQERQQTLQAVIGQIESVSRLKPVLMLFEDIHWADPSTLELLHILVERIQPTSILLIMTARPEFRPPWSVSGHITFLSLRRLRRDRMVAMVEGLAGAERLPEGMIDRIIDRAGGVPLFIEELTRHVIESLSQSEQRGDGASDLEDFSIPATLQDSLMARLDRLGRGKAAAQIAAVIGRNFSCDILAELVPFDRRELDRALEELTESGLVFQRGFGPDATYEFKHALVQSAAEGTLLHSRRRALHREIAALLGKRHSGSDDLRPEVLAYHHRQAEDFENAVDQYRRAGQLAQERSSYSEAINHFETAIALVARLRDPQTRLHRELELLSHLRNTLIVAKGYAAPEVEKACVRSRELCEQLKDETKLFDVLWNLTGFYMVRGDHETTVPINDRLLEIAEKSGKRELTIMAKDTVGQTMFYLGRFNEARALFDETVALYDLERDKDLCVTYAEEDPLVASLVYQAMMDVLTCYPDRAVETGARACEFAERLPYELTQALALSYSARVHAFRRDFARTHRASETMLALCVEKGIAYYRASALMAMGWSRALGNGDPEGHRMILDGIQYSMESGAHAEHSLTATMLAESHMKMGTFEEALAILDQDLEQSQRSKEAWLISETLRLKGELLHALDAERDEEALDFFQQSLSAAGRTGARFLQLRSACSLAHMLIARGMEGDARMAVEPIYRSFNEGFDTLDLQEARKILGR